MYRILIVDDEAPIRDLLAKTISQRGNGFEVVGVAADGEEALAHLRTLKPDIVVTDIYMPGMNGLAFLQKAQAEGMMPKTIIISGYDEFDYARKAISLGVTDYLLKPFLPQELFQVLDRIKEEIAQQRQLAHNMNSLQTLVDQQLSFLEERLCTQLVRGTLQKEPAADEREAEIFDFKADFFCAGQMLPMGIIGQNGAEAWNSAQHQELAMLYDEYFSPGYSIHCVSLNSTQTAVMFTGRSASRAVFLSEIRSGLTKCQASLKRHYNITLRCALGDVKKDWRELPDSYEEAQGTWRNQIHQDALLMMYDEAAEALPEDNGDATRQIRRLKKEIMLEVGLGKTSAALSGLESLMRCYAALSSKKSDYIFVSAGELGYAIANELEEQYGELPEEIKKQVGEIRQAMECIGLMELKSALVTFVNRCCSWVQQRSDMRSGKRLMEQMTKVIEEEIANPELSLELVASRLNFSPHYIRQVFKQHTGEAFTDHVIRKRMEKAGTLLRTSTVLVQDAAEACGYSNQRYFASSFKKFYGQTPSEYKQNTGKKE